MRKIGFIVIMLMVFVMQVYITNARGLKTSLGHNLIVVKVVNSFSKLNCIEPLMIRAVVFKVNRQKGFVLARVVSETHRGQTILIEGRLSAKKGGYISGAFCRNKLFIAPKRGAR